MAAVVVAGVVNVQQTIPIEGFPVPYSPVRYAHSPLCLDVAGVGGNVARGLAALGDEVRLATFLADDDAGRLARDTLAREGLAGLGVLRADATAQSAVLVDPDGRRQITADLKGLPTARYPAPLSCWRWRAAPRCSPPAGRSGSPEPAGTPPAPTSTRWPPPPPPPRTTRDELTASG